MFLQCVATGMVWLILYYFTAAPRCRTNFDVRCKRFSVSILFKIRTLWSQSCFNIIRIPMMFESAEFLSNRDIRSAESPTIFGKGGNNLMVATHLLTSNITSSIFSLIPPTLFYIHYSSPFCNLFSFSHPSSKFSTPLPTLLLYSLLLLFLHFFYILSSSSPYTSSIFTPPLPTLLLYLLLLLLHFFHILSSTSYTSSIFSPPPTLFYILSFSSNTSSIFSHPLYSLLHLLHFF